MDARRTLLARFVLAHRLSAADPLAPEEAAWEPAAAAALLGAKVLEIADAAPLLV